MNEQEKKELLKMTSQILGSKTKYTEVFQRLIRIYHDDLGKAQTLVEPPKKEEVFIRVRREGSTVLQEMKELKKMTRQIYEDRTGQKWRPSLRVIQGGATIKEVRKNESSKRC